jgi:hypothetical protein
MDREEIYKMYENKLRECLLEKKFGETLSADDMQLALNIFKETFISSRTTEHKIIESLKREIK